MQVKILYKTIRPDGGVTVSPDKPESEEYTEMLRLIADEGKLLTQDGEVTCPCADVETADGWFEVDAPEEEEGGDMFVKDIP